LLIYALLLWNPMTYEAPTMGRVMRQHVYIPLGILIFAGLVALYYRCRESFREQARWAAVLGFSLGGFWLTREESIWIVPSVVLLGSAWWVTACRSSPGARRTLWQVVLTMTVFALLPVTFVSWENYRHYGLFGTGEFHASAFRDAYGAMVRVKIGPDLPQVPVTRQAREAMYLVSPTFAELKPYLDGKIGSDWAEKEMYPASERQLRGGWFVWALRDCVVAAGHGHSAREAMRFYRKMADEINQACDEGRLPARSHRSGFAPVLKEGEAAQITRMFFSFCDFVISFRSFSVFTPVSIGDNNDLEIFRDLTRDRLSPSERATSFPMPNQNVLDGHKLSMLEKIGRALRPVLLVLFYVSGAMLLLRTAQLIRHRRLAFPYLLSLASLGGLMAYILINAIVQVTSFPLTAVSTFSPIYPLLLIFIVSCFWDAGSAWLAPTPDPSLLPARKTNA
jgi:hypothetical protein